MTTALVALTPNYLGITILPRSSTRTTATPRTGWRGPAHG